MTLTVWPADPVGEVRAVVACELDASPGTRVDCGACQRRLAQSTRYARPRLLFADGQRGLSEMDWCRWCARAISARAEALAPRDGFAAFVRDVLGQRETGTPTRRPMAVSV